MIEAGHIAGIATTIYFLVLYLIHINVLLASYRLSSYWSNAIIAIYHRSIVSIAVSKKNCHQHFQDLCYGMLSDML